MMALINCTIEKMMLLEGAKISKKGRRNKGVQSISLTVIKYYTNTILYSNSNTATYIRGESAEGLCSELHNVEVQHAHPPI